MHQQQARVQALPNGHGSPQNQPPISTSTNGNSRRARAENPDSATVLLTLADEYFTAAKKLDNDTEDYFKLIATGLGCLESVLNNTKIAALREAQVSLTYAQILYDETENYDDAERVLTKAIDLCERNKYIDLKYQLQLLQALVLYESKPKAAIKNLLTVIEEVQAYKHNAWEYALRFQLAMLYLSTGNIRDIHSGIQQMEQVATIADNHTDHAVVVFAAILEAMLHLMTSTSDAILFAQRALAKARAMQLDPVVGDLAQLEVAIELVDLCCSLRESDHEQGDPKRRRLHEVFSKVRDDQSWVDSGSKLFLPLNNLSLRGVQLQDGGLLSKRGDDYGLTFSWLDVGDAEALGFLVSASNLTTKNTTDGGRSERFLGEGMQYIEQTIDEDTGARQVRRTPGRLEWRKLLGIRYRIELALLYCSTGRWDSAKAISEEAAGIADRPTGGAPLSVGCMLGYLKGVILQGTGHLDEALETYRLPLFDLSRFQKASSSQQSTPPHQPRIQELESSTTRDIALLANMNALLIINDPSHPQHTLLGPIIEQLKPLITTSNNRNITASYTLIHSLVTNSGILKNKNQLISALNAAKAVSNTQISALVLMTMQQQFFRGLTDVHANKCVNAVRQQMRNWGNPMWMAVTSGMEAEALEFQARWEQADAKRKEGADRLKALPSRVRMMATEENTVCVSGDRN